MATAGQGSTAGADSPNASRLAHGPPYPPQHQGLGGQPLIIPDVPISAVFLALFTFAAIGHMGLFQINMRRRHKKFVFNAAIFGFCITRIIATSLRIAWANHPTNISLAMSAQVFVYAGVPILFITNLFFIQRLVRAQHPHFGWSKPFTIWLPAFVMLQIVTILALISAVVVQFYKPDELTQRWTRGVQLYGATLFGVAAILPLPMVLVSTVAKTHPDLRDQPTDNFGEKGTISTKITLLLVTAIPLSLGAWYRAITSCLDPIPMTAASPWYFSKTSFYIFNFTIEILVTLFWLGIRIDRYFIVPDGCRGAYSYGNGTVFAGEYGNEKPNMNHDSRRNLNSDSRSYISRDSTCTIPPPTLHRADSWGSMTRYMSREHIASSPLRVESGHNQVQTPTRQHQERWWSNPDVSPLTDDQRYSRNSSTGKWEVGTSSMYSAVSSS